MTRIEVFVMKRIEILSEYKCRYLFRVWLRVTDIISTKISLKLRSALDDKTVIETKLSYFLHQIHLSALFSELLHVMYIESSSPHVPIKSFRLCDTNIKLFSVLISIITLLHLNAPLDPKDPIYNFTLVLL